MISYYFEDTDFVFKGKTLNNRWLRLVAESEIRRIGDISIIFCSDNYILDVNQQYLQHDYFTDIITFDYCEGKDISGELYISIDTVQANAVEYGEDFDRELHRVIIHGILHLLGWDDHSEEDIKEMRKAEDSALDLLDRIFAENRQE